MFVYFYKACLSAAVSHQGSCNTNSLPDVSIDFPLGNSKHNESSYVRTMPSVLRNLEARSESEKSRAVYLSEITKASSTSHMSTLQPRNTKQVENLRHKVLENKRITHDGLYNVTEIAIGHARFCAFSMYSS